MSVLKSGRGVAALIVVLSSLSAAACTEGGLPNKNKPLADAMNSEWRYPVYAKTPEAAKPIQVAGHTWQITGATETVPTSMLQPVGTVNGAQIFSLKSDKAPYDRLYTPAENGRYTVVSAIN